MNNLLKMDKLRYFSGGVKYHCFKYIFGNAKVQKLG